MKNVRHLAPYLLSCIYVILWVVAVASAQGHANEKTVNDLTKAIAAVRSGKTPMDRASAAENVARVTKRLGSKIDDHSIVELTSLLDSREGAVHYWVAEALGYVGPRAKGAVPRLLAILAETECVEVVGGLTSEPAIRVALQRIGASPPPPNCPSEK